MRDVKNTGSAVKPGKVMFESEKTRVEVRGTVGGCCCMKRMNTHGEYKKCRIKCICVARIPQHFFLLW